MAKTRNIPNPFKNMDNETLLDEFDYYATGKEMSNGEITHMKYNIIRDEILRRMKADAK